MRFPAVTVASVLGLAYVMNTSGMTNCLGLVFTKTGHLFPFIAPFLGWLGVFLTGSDTSSNVLFGGLQKATAEQLGLNPILTGAANTSGGVMGKMISPQSLAVAYRCHRHGGGGGDPVPLYPQALLVFDGNRGDHRVPASLCVFMDDTVSQAEPRGVGIPADLNPRRPNGSSRSHASVLALSAGSPAGRRAHDTGGMALGAPFGPDETCRSFRRLQTSRIQGKTK